MEEAYSMGRMKNLVRGKGAEETYYSIGGIGTEEARCSRPPVEEVGLGRVLQASCGGGISFRHSCGGGLSVAWKNV